MVREKYFYKTLLPLIVIISLQNLITFSVALADNVMLGMYSETVLSGAAIVNQIQFLLQMIVTSIGEGLVVIASRYWGEGDTESIKKVTAVAVMIGAVVSVAMWAVVFFIPDPVMTIFTDSPGVIREGSSYMQIVCFSYIFFSVNTILLASQRSVETVRIGFVVSLCSLCVNIFLNYMLIFGNLGAPEMGGRGAAIATLIARIVECTITCVFTFRIDRKIAMKFRELFYINKDLFVNFIKVGMPVVISGAMWGVAMAIQTAILGHMGTSAIAANSIATTIFQVVTVVTYASGSASAVIIAKTLGEGHTEKIKPYTITLQIIFLIIGVVTGVVLFALRDVVLSFYAISPETESLALAFITILSVTVVGTSYQAAVLTGIVRGGGDTKFVMKNDLIFMWGIVLPVSALGAFLFGWSPVIVFICLKSDQILKCAVAAVKVNRYKWIKKVHS